MIRSKKGFTLVELLVVIAIIAIIAAVAVPVTIGQINKAKVSTAESEAQNAVAAIQNGSAVIASDAATYPGGLTEANVLKYLNSTFVGIKQLISIDIVPNADGITSQITVKANEDVKDNGQSIVVNKGEAIIVLEECHYSVKADGSWELA